VVAVTAIAMSGDREQCLAAGMNDYLAKPFQVETLEATLARVLLRARVVDTASFALSRSS
jgi:CheY-like chemotaxis protein